MKFNNTEIVNISTENTELSDGLNYEAFVFAKIRELFFFEIHFKIFSILWYFSVIFWYFWGFSKEKFDIEKKKKLKKKIQKFFRKFFFLQNFDAFSVFTVFQYY